jgi:aryl-alcohol dehydrogenase-like predicted oxidoreductase
MTVSNVMQKTRIEAPGPVGFGCYRVSRGNAGQQAAMLQALCSGVRLIDTSSNYADGGSEELVGQVLARLFETGELARGEVFVVSKAGYIQGRNLKIVQSAAQAGKPFEQVVDYAEGLQHCIHPEFLKDQLKRSLKRLGLDRLDALLLHNPEYWMSWCEAHGIERAKAQEEYYSRIKAAFGYLETEARAGRIGCYGISSNTFVEPAGSFAHTSLSRVWNLAQEMGPEHHFGIAQFPLEPL